MFFVSRSGTKQSKIKMFNVRDLFESFPTSLKLVKPEHSEERYGQNKYAWASYAGSCAGCAGKIQTAQKYPFFVIPVRSENGLNYPHYSRVPGLYFFQIIIRDFRTLF